MTVRVAYYDDFPAHHIHDRPGRSGRQGADGVRGKVGIHDVPGKTAVLHGIDVDRLPNGTGISGAQVARHAVFLGAADEHLAALANGGHGKGRRVTAQGHKLNRVQQAGLVRRILKITPSAGVSDVVLRRIGLDRDKLKALQFTVHVKGFHQESLELRLVRVVLHAMVGQVGAGTEDVVLLGLASHGVGHGSVLLSPRGSGTGGDSQREEQLGQDLQHGFHRYLPFRARITLTSFCM